MIALRLRFAHALLWAALAFASRPVLAIGACTSAAWSEVGSYRGFWAPRFAAAGASPRAVEAAATLLKAVDESDVLDTRYYGLLRDALPAVQALSRTEREALASQLLASYPRHARIHSPASYTPKRTVDAFVHAAMEPVARIDEAVSSGRSVRQAFEGYFDELRRRLPAGADIGSYAASDVLRLAEEVQRELRVTGGSATLYGSVPNGLARLGSGADLDFTTSLARDGRYDGLFEAAAARALPEAGLYVDRLHAPSLDGFLRVGGGLSLEITPERIRLGVSRPGADLDQVNPLPPVWYEIAPTPADN